MKSLRTMVCDETMQDHRFVGPHLKLGSARIRSTRSTKYLLIAAPTFIPPRAIRIEGSSSSFQGSRPNFFHAVYMPEISPGTPTDKPPSVEEHTTNFCNCADQRDMTVTFARYPRLCLGNFTSERLRRRDVFEHVFVGRLRRHLPRVEHHHLLPG